MHRSLRRIARPVCDGPAQRCNLPRHSSVCAVHARTTRNDLDGAHTIDHTKHPSTVRLASGLAGLKGLRSKKREQGSASHTSQPTSSKHDAPARWILGQKNNVHIRTRFAPSPTGYMHLGSLRTALYNNLASAATQGGTFLLRIEDTDQTRLVADAEERILDDLKWAGLQWDEGPDCGGPHGPYRQSERLDIYKEHSHKLLEQGHAYRCFCTNEQLEQQKQIQHNLGQSTRYPGTCRSVSREESDERAARGESHVLRFKGDAFGRPKFRDAIYGPYEKKEDEEDFILMKTDGFPTYHLANVVDDHLMRITHVIRGEEWLISTPKHIALYKAFGWEPPTFAHLGLLVNNDGTKLSKRHAAIGIADQRTRNVAPMALTSWLATLGCSFYPKTPVPRNVQEMADSLAFKFTRGAIRLNPEKLRFFQGEYYERLVKLRQQAETLTSNPLTPDEDDLLRNTALFPLIREMKALESPVVDASMWPDPAWNITKSPVPVLSNQPKDHIPEDVYTYLQPIFLRDIKRAVNPSLCLATYPYLFWRVPQTLYKSSIAAWLADKPLDTAVLDALSTSLNTDTTTPKDWWDAVRRAGGSSSSPPQQDREEHRYVRLIATGMADRASPDTPWLFAQLGREEWRVRVATVRELVLALNAEQSEL